MLERSAVQQKHCSHYRERQRRLQRCPYCCCITLLLFGTTAAETSPHDVPVSSRSYKQSADTHAEATISRAHLEILVMTSPSLLCTCIAAGAVTIFLLPPDDLSGQGLPTNGGRRPAIFGDIISVVERHTLPVRYASRLSHGCRRRDILLSCSMPLLPRIVWCFSGSCVYMASKTNLWLARLSATTTKPSPSVDWSQKLTTKTM